jgi:hypothetical protein
MGKKEAKNGVKITVQQQSVQVERRKNYLASISEREKSSKEINMLIRKRGKKVEKFG